MGDVTGRSRDRWRAKRAVEEEGAGHRMGGAKGQSMISSRPQLATSRPATTLNKMPSPHPHQPSSRSSRNRHSSARVSHAPSIEFASDPCLPCSLVPFLVSTFPTTAHPSLFVLFGVCFLPTPSSILPTPSTLCSAEFPPNLYILCSYCLPCLSIFSSLIRSPTSVSVAPP